MKIELVIIGRLVIILIAFHAVFSLSLTLFACFSLFVFESDCLLVSKCFDSLWLSRQQPGLRMSISLSLSLFLVFWASICAQKQTVYS